MFIPTYNIVFVKALDVRLLFCFHKRPCKPMATASSANNCCKCLASLIMILPYCPPPKRNKNGNHLQLRPKKGLIKSESSLSKRFHQLLDPRLIPQHKQCKRAGCVSRGTSVTHTHAQCFYKTAEKRSASPPTNLLAGREKTSFNSRLGRIIRGVI